MVFEFNLRGVSMVLADELYKDFEELETDEERWVWVKINQDKNITVMCDNDDTFIQIDEDEDCASFDNYIGNSDGVFSLLEAFNIKAESV
jgi:hypothetical protein